MATDGATVPPDAVPLRRNRNFQLLWIGQALSELGSSTSQVAVPLLLLALTGSALVAGTVTTVRVVAALLVQLPGGALVDRVDRRRVMLACDALRALAIGALALAIAAHHVNAWTVGVSVVVVTALTTPFYSAQMSTIGAVVPQQQIPSATAANEARNHSVGLVGPPLGGILYSIATAVPFAVDAVSYVASFLAIGAMRGEFRPVRPAGHGRLWQDVVEGLRFTWTHRSLRAVVLIAALLNLAFQALGFGLIVVLRETGHSARLIGLAVGVIAIGGLIGSFFAGWLVRHVPLGRLLVGICIIGVAAVLVSAELAPSAAVTIPIAVVIVLGPALNSGLDAKFFEITPDHLRGRADSALGFGSMSLSAIAPIAIGALLELTSPAVALASTATPLVVAAVLATSFMRSEANDSS